MMVPFVDLNREFQIIKNEVLSVIQRVFERSKFILGEEVSLFEEEFAHYCGVRYAVGVGSGTDAIYLALKACGVGKGDKVITVSHSFIATALAISFTGAEPVFVDIDPQTYTMDPNKVEGLLKRKRKNVKAIIPVHIYGHPAEMYSIMEIADRYGLIVIEDACQAHGAEYKGKRVGSLGELGCFSFYPTKNLGAYGDGGIIVTNNKKFYEKLLLLRNYGGKKRYHHFIKGENSRLDEIQASILRVKLRFLDQWNEKRRTIALIYKERLKESEVICPVEKEGLFHVYHLFVIRSKRRDSLQSFLRENGIETLIHYPIPIHLQKAFKDLRYKRGDLPITERFCKEFLSLPLFNGITESEIDMILTKVSSFGKEIYH